ncbi:MAG: TonB-dependent receptor [Bacteroidales bacterium]|nr:TonB-dependent receptor [Bacteroidales bacterium]
MNHLIKTLLVVTAILFSSFSLRAQGGDVTGKVTEAGGEPVIGAAVFWEGTSVATMTDYDGNYKIPFQKGKKLVINLIGMKDVVLAPSAPGTFNVTMQTDDMRLEDAVVIGYGTQARKDLTGSISSVSSEELRKSGSSNVVGALQGRVAGLSIVSQSGEPGAGTQIKIRGNNSINAGTTPLFVIDGMQMDVSSGEVATESTTGAGSFDPMSFLNPNDIQSIEVLKDASATAIYGSRGANGVIIITTKSGAGSDKTLVNFDASVGISNVPKYIEMLDKQEFMDYKFARGDYGWQDYGVDTTGDGIPDTPKDASAYQGYDWQKLMYRTAVTQNYNVSVSAMAGMKTQLLASLGYLNQQGLVVNNDYVRYTGRLKVDHQVNKKLKIGANVTFGRNVSNGAVSSGGGSLGYSGLIQMIYLERPVNFITEDDRSEYPHGLKNLLTLVSDLTYRKMDYNRLIGNVYADWKIIPDLTFLAQASGDWSGSTLWQYYNSESRWGASRNGYGTNKQVNSLSWNASATLTYKHSWAGKHNFDAMIGGELSTYHSDYMTVNSYNFSDESTGAFFIGKGGITETPQQDYSNSSRMSLFGRVNYNYDSKYYITLNMRADGSSKFYAGNRVGYFPSASIAWRLSKENFMAGAGGWLDDLKFRVSAGSSGNDRISTYASLATLSINYYAANGAEIMGMAPNTPANPKLKWETTYQYDAGFDLSLFKERLKITFDIYYKDTRDMLYRSVVSAQSGYTEKWDNLGKVTNKGIELSINTHNIDTRNFSWATDFTFDLSRNRVEDIGGVEYTSVNISSGQLSTDISRIMVGQPIGVGYGYVWDGNYQLDDFIITDKMGNVLPSDVVNSDNMKNFTYTLKDGVPSINSKSVQPGDRKYKDIWPVNPDGTVGDGVITTEDRTVISDSNPKFTMGMGNTLRWKDFDLNFFLEAVVGRQVMNEFKLRSESGLTGGTQYNNLTKAAWYGHWTPENASQTYPRLLNNTNTYVSSYFVEDASFLRIKTISLGYNLSKDICDKIRINGLRISLNIDNAWVFTSYSGLDPDVSYNSTLFPGLDRLSYPKARTYTLGLSVKF